MGNRLFVERRYRDFLYWLSPTDYGVQQTDLMDKRHEGTGQWFMKSPHLVAWVDGRTDTLHCLGIPSAGKTFMTAIVVDRLRQMFSGRADIGIAVLYCSYSTREQQTKKKLLAGLLRQLVKLTHFESEDVQALYGQCKDAGRKLSSSDLYTLVQPVASTSSPIFIVIDALDECESENWSPLLSELRSLRTLLPAIRLMIHSVRTLKLLRKRVAWETPTVLLL